MEDRKRNTDLGIKGLPRKIEQKRMTKHTCNEKHFSETNKLIVCI